MDTVWRLAKGAVAVAGDNSEENSGISPKQRKKRLRSIVCVERQAEAKVE